MATSPSSDELRREANTHFHKSKAPGLCPTLRGSHLEKARARYAAAVAAADAARFDASDSRDQEGAALARADLALAEKNLGVAHLHVARRAAGGPDEIGHLRLAATHLLKAALARTHVAAGAHAGVDAEDAWLRSVGERLREAVARFVSASTKMDSAARAEAVQTFVAALPRGTLATRAHAAVFSQVASAASPPASPRCRNADEAEAVEPLGVAGFVIPAPASPAAARVSGEVGALIGALHSQRHCHEALTHRAHELLRLCVQGVGETVAVAEPVALLLSGSAAPCGEVGLWRGGAPVHGRLVPYTAPRGPLEMALALAQLAAAVERSADLAHLAPLLLGRAVHLLGLDAWPVRDGPLPAAHAGMAAGASLNPNRIAARPGLAPIEDATTPRARAYSDPPPPPQWAKSAQQPAQPSGTRSPRAGAQGAHATPHSPPHTHSSPPRATTHSSPQAPPLQPPPPSSAPPSTSEPPRSRSEPRRRSARTSTPPPAPGSASASRQRPPRLTGPPPEVDLETELAALRRASRDVYSLLAHIYKAHPPRAKGSPRVDTARLRAENIQRAVLHALVDYHPDRLGGTRHGDECGAHWYELCVEITKALTERHTILKRAG